MSFRHVPGCRVFWNWQTLRALLALRGGALGIDLTAAEAQRVSAEIGEKVRHWRFHLSRLGIAAYWRDLACAEGRATGGRLRHILADPRSLLRAIVTRGSAA